MTNQDKIIVSNFSILLGLSLCGALITQILYAYITLDTSVIKIEEIMVATLSVPFFLLSFFLKKRVTSL